MEFTKPLKDMEVMENQEVSLVCEVNKPGKTATWQCNGQDLAPSDHIRIAADACTHSLTIPAARLEDEAVYKCVVGDRKTSARLTVKGTIWWWCVCVCSHISRLTDRKREGRERERKKERGRERERNDVILSDIKFSQKSS